MNQKLEAPVTESIYKAVEQVFPSLFLAKATRGEEREIADHKIAADVSGIVTLSQNNAGGLLVVSFQKKVLLPLIAKVYGKPVNSLDPSASMVVGELTNVIYCAAKKELNEAGHAFGMAIPSVIVGNQHFVFSHFRGQIHVREFVTESGNFQVYTCMERSSAQPAQAA